MYRDVIGSNVAHFFLHSCANNEKAEYQSFAWEPDSYFNFLGCTSYNGTTSASVTYAIVNLGVFQPCVSQHIVK
jgi:hypothetical protein